MSKPLSIFWFRRDFRLYDNAGLYHALKENKNVQPIFIFDPIILDKLEDKSDARVSFIHQEIERLQKELIAIGSNLWIFYESPEIVFSELIPALLKNKSHLNKIYFNHDYEPYATIRDEKINKIATSQNIEFVSCKDHVIFEKAEIVKEDGLPYTVFTAYKNKWFKKLQPSHLESYSTQEYFSNFNPIDYSINYTKIPQLKEMGFIKSKIEFPIAEFESILKDYSENRNIPSLKGTSKIGIHLRFGTVSIRELARISAKKSETWLNELIWRDFYFQIIWHFPHAVNSAFKKPYDQIDWRNSEIEFDKWCNGQTGYPIVDAGMRELNATGFMHNRVRMVVASFLIKHLLIDWRWGEAYFAKKLLDFELSSNNGGWQWAAGSGCDAAPYFRIFNPYEQTKKFDPQLKYIRKWVPEFQELNYTQPIVEHKFARERCLAVYKAGLQKFYK